VEVLSSSSDAASGGGGGGGSSSSSAGEDDAGSASGKGKIKMEEESVCRGGRSLKRSWDVTFVTDVPDCYQCAVCLKPFQNPVIVNGCGHEFCEGCLRSALARKAVCPLCRDPVEKGEKGFTKLRRVEQQLQELQVLCPNAGCGEQFKQCELDSHLLACPHEPLQCVHAEFGCAFAAPRKSFGNHASSCVYEKLSGFICKMTSEQAKLREENREQRTQISRLQQQLSNVGTLMSASEARNKRLVRINFLQKPSPDSVLTIHVIHSGFGPNDEYQNNVETVCRLNMVTPMSRVMETLEERVQTFKCHLYVDGLPDMGGSLVSNTDSAAVLGLEDGNKVYAVFTWSGPGSPSR